MRCSTYRWAAAAEDYFWADELFVSTAGSQAAQGQLDRAPSSCLSSTGSENGGSIPCRWPGAWRPEQRRPGHARLSPWLLCRFLARSRRQQYRGRLSRRGKPKCAFGEDHFLGWLARMGRSNGKAIAPMGRSNRESGCAHGALQRGTVRPGALQLGIACAHRALQHQSWKCVSMTSLPENRWSVSRACSGLERGMCASRYCIWSASTRRPLR